MDIDEVGPMGGHETHSSMADRDSALISDCWYVAALSAELGAGLLDRWLLGRNVLLYRAGDGLPVALDNRCPHRSFPLSRGHREGDRVACGYHGMTFDRTGQCVRTPAGGAGRTGIRLRRYAVVERAPLVWIWMGDPQAADPALLPDYFPLQEPGWQAVSGYCSVEANYVGLHENLQDLSHFEYLHRASIGIPDQTAGKVEMSVTGTEIRTVLTYADVPVPPLWASIIPLAGTRVTRTIREAFKSPALCDAHTTITDLAQPAGAARDFDTRILHFITPEAQHRTHYWWFFLRNFATASTQVSDTLRAGIAGAFEEDKQALESIDHLSRRDLRTEFRELSFRSDRSGVLMRRRLREWGLRKTADITDGRC